MKLRLLALLYFVRKYKVLVVAFIMLTACQNSYKENTSLKAWILDAQHQLTLDSDSILQSNIIRKDLDSNWLSFTEVTTIHADNSLGQLAKKAGDFSECIVTTIEFYHDPTKKRRIMIAAVDSTCVNRIKLINLDTDSTDNFVFGKLTKALY